MSSAVREKKLVFLEQLVLIEALGKSQFAQLHRLGNDRYVGRDDVRGMLQVARDAVDQDRDVIEQLFRREDAVRRQLHPIADAVEPPTRELIARIPQARCERGCQRAVDVGIHV